MSHARVARLLQTMFLASAVVDVLIIDAVTMSSHYMLVIGLSLTYSGVVRLSLSRHPHALGSLTALVSNRNAISRR